MSIRVKLGIVQSSYQTQDFLSTIPTFKLISGDMKFLGFEFSIS